MVRVCVLNILIEKIKGEVRKLFYFQQTKDKKKGLHLQGNVYGKGSMKGNYYRVGGKYEWEWEEGNEERKGKGK